MLLDFLDTLFGNMFWFEEVLFSFFSSLKDKKSYYIRRKTCILVWVKHVKSMTFSIRFQKWYFPSMKNVYKETVILKEYVCFLGKSSKIFVTFHGFSWRFYFSSTKFNVLSMEFHFYLWTKVIFLKWKSFWFSIEKVPTFLWKQWIFPKFSSIIDKIMCKFPLFLIWFSLFLLEFHFFLWQKVNLLSKRL